jgi:hypothetical protein
VALIRCNDVALLAVFNDSTAVTPHLLRILKNVTGPLSEVQLREVMVEAASCNLHLKNRPEYASLTDLRDRRIKIVANLPERPEFWPVDFRIRGKLMNAALRSLFRMPSVQDRPMIDWKSVRAGRHTFLFDANGEFIAS